MGKVRQITPSLNTERKEILRIYEIYKNPLVFDKLFEKLNLERVSPKHLCSL